MEVPHSERLLSDKESERWLSTAEAAKPVLKPAALVTEVSDRESDIYAKWALYLEPGFQHPDPHDARPPDSEGGGKLSSAPLRAAGEATVELRRAPGRAARTARLAVGFARVEVMRPDNTIEEGLPKTVSLSLVQVREIDPPGAPSRSCGDCLPPIPSRTRPWPGGWSVGIACAGPSSSSSAPSNSRGFRWKTANWRAPSGSSN